MKVKDLEAEIMRLTPKDQVYLFDKLLHVIDGEEIEPDRPPADLPGPRAATATKKPRRDR